MKRTPKGSHYHLLVGRSVVFENTPPSVALKKGGFLFGFTPNPKKDGSPQARQSPACVTWPAAKFLFARVQLVGWLPAAFSFGFRKPEALEVLVVAPFCDLWSLPPTKIDIAAGGYQEDKFGC